MIMRKLAILGAGGHAKVVLDIAQAMKRFSDIQLYDKAYSAVVDWIVLDHKVIGDTQKFISDAKNDNKECIVAIGDNAIRAKNFHALIENHITITKALIHPSAIIAPSATLGLGAVAMAGVIINPDAHIGSNVILNTGAIVEHDCHIEDHVHIAPAVTLCGGVKVGAYSWIGVGATIIEGTSIGKNVYIGAGAVVTKDIPSNSVAVGVPAKVIKQVKDPL